MQGEALTMAAGTSSTFAALRRFARSKSPVEQCELCSAALAHAHPHLVQPASRQIICACEACATLFDGMAAGKYRRVSREIQLLKNFQMTDAQWESLLIPINMAFFFRSSVENRMVVFYPSPAGAVESLLPLDAWHEIVQENSRLNRLQPDIESLLVNRIGHAHGMSQAEYYIAPIDECYRLVGLIRANWKGLSGGSEVWAEIGRFFSALRAAANVVGEEAHA
jgi:hypothetical protein